MGAHKTSSDSLADPDVAEPLVNGTSDPLKDDDDDIQIIRLKPQLSLLNSVTVIVGCIIGSGIFISPKGVIQHCGSVGASLVIWFLCGLYCMIGAYCFAELGTAIPRSGAEYAYMMEAFGPFPAFLRMWVELVVCRPCNSAIVALAFATYILEPFYDGCDAPEDATRLLAAACICILMFVNAYDVKWSTRVQDVFTYAKLLALALIIVTGFVQIGRGKVRYFEAPFENTNPDVGHISLAFYSGLFAYNGWNYLNYVIEEMKNPKKNLPIAICFSCVLVTLVYVLANVAYFTTVTPDEITGASAVAVVFSKRLYGPMWWIMPVFVSLSTFGGVNGILFTTSRLCFVGAREGHMPQILSMVQINRLTPAPSVIFMGLFSLIYLCSTDMYALINYVGFVTWLSIGLSVFSLIVFRWTRPNMERPIKVSLFWPVIYCLFSLFLVILPLYASPTETGMGCLIIATGIPVYFIFIKWQNKPKSFNRFMDASTLLLQKLLMVVPEEKKSC